MEEASNADKSDFTMKSREENNPKLQDSIVQLKNQDSEIQLFKKPVMDQIIPLNPNIKNYHLYELKVSVFENTKFKDFFYAPGQLDGKILYTLDQDNNLVKHQLSALDDLNSFNNSTLFNDSLVTSQQVSFKVKSDPSKKSRSGAARMSKADKDRNKTNLEQTSSELESLSKKIQKEN
jgi:hypothetical protein